MARKTPEQREAIKVIDRNGGPTKLAQKIGLPEKSGPMTVHNWKSRGLPWWFRAQHADLIEEEKKAA